MGSTTLEKQDRKAWIDVLRAVAIIFVLLGHQLSGKTAFFVFTSPIKIPLFFMITGYVFNYNRKKTSDFFKNIFQKLVIPWLCLTVPFVLIQVPFKGLPVLINGLYSIVSGETAWYMPCCIIAEIIWFFVNKLNRKHELILVTILLTIMGIFLGKNSILDFAMINRAMTVQSFILMGYLFKSYEEKISTMKSFYMILMVIIYIGMGVVSLIIWPDMAIDVHQNFYYNYFFSFAMILVGGGMLFSVSMRFKEAVNVHAPKFVLFIGRNTLVYYLLTSYNATAFVYLLRILNVTLQDPAYKILSFIVSFALCGIEALIILRFFPWMLGKKTSINRKKNIEC